MGKEGGAKFGPNWPGQGLNWLRTRHLDGGGGGGQMGQVLTHAMLTSHWPRCIKPRGAGI